MMKYKVIAFICSCCIIAVVFGLRLRLDYDGLKGRLEAMDEYTVDLNAMREIQCMSAILNDFDLDNRQEFRTEEVRSTSGSTGTRQYVWATYDGNDETVILRKEVVFEVEVTFGTGIGPGAVVPEDADYDRISDQMQSLEHPAFEDDFLGTIASVGEIIILIFNVIRIVIIMLLDCVQYTVVLLGLFLYCIGL